MRIFIFLSVAIEASGWRLLNANQLLTDLGGFLSEEFLREVYSQEPILPTTSRKLIPQFQPQSCESPFLLFSGTIYATFQSSGTRLAFKHAINILTSHFPHTLSPIFRYSVVVLSNPAAFSVFIFYKNLSTSTLVIFRSALSKTHWKTHYHSRPVFYMFGSFIAHI